MCTNTEKAKPHQKPMYLKFYVYKKKAGIMASAYISDDLLNLIKKQDFASLEMGFNKTSRTVFLKFHNNDDAISLINNKGNYKRSITVNAQLRELLMDEEINLANTFILEEIENNLFSLNKKISSNEYINNEKHSIKWFGLQNNSKNVREENDLWIKFQKQGLKNNSMSISNGLKRYAKDKNMTHLKFGYTRENSSIFIQFNNNDEGTCLLTVDGEYKKHSLNAKRIASHLDFVGTNLELKTPYFLSRIDDFTFRIGTSEETTIDYENIQWLFEKDYSNGPNQNGRGQQLKENSNKKDKHLKEEMWIKFYRNGSQKGNFRVSEGLLNLAEQNNVTHIQFGYSKKTKTVYFQLNKTGRGYSLLTRNKEYKQTGISISVALFYFSAANINIEYKKIYYLTKEENLIFKLNNIGGNSLESETIHWISNEDIKHQSRDTIISEPDRNQNVHIYKRIYKRSLTRKEKINSLSYKDFELGLGYEELEENDLLNGRYDDVNLEDLKENKNKFSAFVKFSTDEPFPYCLVPSKKFMRICKKQGFTHIQLRIKSNSETKEVFIELNKSGKGVSLVNPDFTYKKVINVTSIFNSINKNEEIFQLNAWYSGEKIEDSTFRIESQLYL